LIDSIDTFWRLIDDDDLPVFAWTAGVFCAAPNVFVGKIDAGIGDNDLGIDVGGNGSAIVHQTIVIEVDDLVE
jgi:hypothetical protein